MAVNQKYDEYRVNSLPNSGLKAGDRYYLNVGKKQVMYIVSDSLELIRDNSSEFLEKDTMQEMRNLSTREIWALQNNIYKGVKLNGYYTKGDTPAPIEYYLTTSTASDDGGSLIEIQGVKFEHIFSEIDPLYFGAIGDGLNDDSDIVEIVLRKGLKIKNDNNVFKITKVLTAHDTHIQIDGLNIKLEGNTLSNGTNLQFSETVIKSGKVDNTSTINELSRTITLDNSSDIKVGDLLRIRCIPQTTGNILNGRQYVIMSTGGNFTGIGAPNNNIGTGFTATSTTPDYGSGGSLLLLWDYDPRAGVTNVTLGEMHKIVSITGNVVELDMPTMTQFSNTLNLQYDIYRPHDFYINNLNIFSEQSGNFGAMSVAFKEPVIQNISLNKTAGTVGLSLGYCYNALVSSPKIVDGFFTGTTTGYAIQCNGGTGTIVDKGVFNNNRRAVDFSGSTPSHLGRVVNCTVISTNATNNTGSCLGGHGGADLSTFENNTLIGGIIGIQWRGGRATIRSNTFIGHTIACVVINFTGEELTIDSNKLIQSKNYATVNTNYFVQVAVDTTFSKLKPLVIQNNIVNEIRTGFIYIGSGVNTTIEGLVVKNNKITLRSNSSGNIVSLLYNTSTGIVTVRKSDFYNNSVIVSNGTYEMGRNVIYDNVFNKGDLGRPVSSTDVSIFVGTGTLSDVQLVVSQSNIDGVNGNVKGQISFTVVGSPISIKISNLFRSDIANIVDLYSREGNPMMITSVGELYIGHVMGDSYNSRFPAGSYVVNFDINYRLNTNYLY